MTQKAITLRNGFTKFGIYSTTFETSAFNITLNYVFFIRMHVHYYTVHTVQTMGRAAFQSPWVKDKYFPAVLHVDSLSTTV